MSQISFVVLFLFSWFVPALCSPLVSVDFYVMSKCPDAQVCELTFLPSLYDLINITTINMHYIARDNSTRDNIICPHGPSECIGNKQQLSVKQLANELNWLNFIACQSKTRTDIPNNALNCANSINLDYNLLQTTVNNIGEELLWNSIQETKLANQTVSCTILINQQYWCQHNNDWVSCAEGVDGQAITNAICSRYQGEEKPKVCELY